MVYFQVDWRDTPPSDRATALMYAAAAGHAARDPAAYIIWSQISKLKGPESMAKEVVIEIHGWVMLSEWFCRCFLCFHFSWFEDVAVALLKAQVGSKLESNEENSWPSLNVQCRLSWVLRVLSFNSISQFPVGSVFLEPLPPLPQNVVFYQHPGWWQGLPCFGGSEE